MHTSSQLLHISSHHKIACIVAFCILFDIFNNLTFNRLNTLILIYPSNSNVGEDRNFSPVFCQFLLSLCVTLVSCSIAAWFIILWSINRSHKLSKFRLACSDPGSVGRKEKKQLPNRSPSCTIKSVQQKLWTDIKRSSFSYKNAEGWP